MTSGRVVIAGASIAGITAADVLRTAGWDGEIVLIDRESGPAYSRPALTKGILTDAESVDSISLRDPDGTTVRRGETLTHLDLAARRVELASGDGLDFDALIIATGADARRFGVAGEHVVRTLADACRVREAFATARSAIVVGGGFLGVEVASAAVSLGIDVTVVDKSSPLERVLGEFLSGTFVDAARKAGVSIRVSEQVELISDGASVTGVRVNGSPIFADVVICAIGDIPNDGWLSESGLRLASGVLVDATLRAHDRVWAIGDVAVIDHGSATRRTPFWDAAIGHAHVAARNAVDVLAGGSGREQYQPRPYFWTEAFGLSGKFAGQLPALGEPVLVGEKADDNGLLLHWPDHDAPTAAAINYRLPVAKLRSMAIPA